MAEVRKYSDGKPAAKKPKSNASPTNFNCEDSPVLQVSVSELQKVLTLKTSECSKLHSDLCLEREFFQLEKHSALDRISELEKQLLEFQQKHAISKGELFHGKKKIEAP